MSNNDIGGVLGEVVGRDIPTQHGMCEFFGFCRAPKTPPEKTDNTEKLENKKR